MVVSFDDGGGKDEEEENKTLEGLVKEWGFLRVLAGHKYKIQHRDISSSIHYMYSSSSMSSKGQCATT